MQHSSFGFLASDDISEFPVPQSEHQTNNHITTDIVFDGSSTMLPIFSNNFITSPFPHVNVDSMNLTHEQQCDFVLNNTFVEPLGSQIDSNAHSKSCSTTESEHDPLIFLHSYLPFAVANNDIALFNTLNIIQETIKPKARSHMAHSQLSKRCAVPISVVCTFRTNIIRLLQTYILTCKHTY